MATGSAMTNYLEDALLNEVFRNTGYTPAATVYVGLYTVAPGEAGGGTEVSGGSYARQSVTFGAPSGGVVSNSGTVTFPTASANWGTVVAFAISDASSAGNMLVYSNLSASKTINNGDTASFSAGTLSVQFD